MRRRFIIIGIVIFILLAIFIFTGISGLSSKEDNVTKRFKAMAPELSLRYERTKEALDVTEQLGGKRDVTTSGKKSINDFNKAVKEKNLGNQHKYAREIENIIGRLRGNAESAPRLKGQQAVTDAIRQIDKALPGSDVRDAYVKAIKNYEDARTSWRYMASALISGRDAPTQLQFSLPTEE